MNGVGDVKSLYFVRRRQDGFASAGSGAQAVDASTAALQDVTQTAVQSIVDTFGERSLDILRRPGPGPIFGALTELGGLLRAAVQYAS